MLSGDHAPPANLFATELPRAGLDLAALVTTSPLLATARRGDGHPVLVLPGLLTGDPATMLLRGVLRALGHNVLGWTLGTNRGATSQVVSGLRTRLEQLHQESGQRVILVGWSLGGVFAQELARASPRAASATSSRSAAPCSHAAGGLTSCRRWLTKPHTCPR